MPNLSDKALSIFVFAAYHELVGGQPISSVAAHDDSGHGADPAGVTELKEQGLIEIDGDRIVFSEEGENVREEVIGAIRGTAMVHEDG